MNLQVSRFRGTSGSLGTGFERKHGFIDAGPLYDYHSAVLPALVEQPGTTCKKQTLAYKAKCS